MGAMDKGGGRASRALYWVKLRSMPVFWPACVYESYSTAVAHTHDVWALRNVKPALDAEDRILYFFGVGPRACHVVASGSAPNLQLCVVHEDDLVVEDWNTVEEFPLLCSKYHVPTDRVTRAQNNGCFLRACDEATTYARDVQTDENAGELFVTLLTMAKHAHTTGKAVVARESSASPATTPVKGAEKIRKVHGEKTTTRDMVELLKTPGMVTMVAKCWQHMLEAGWEPMTQGDGQVLYKMPGTSFFDFVPNVNLFDSLEKACARYLSGWVKMTSLASSEHCPELTEFLWSMAVGSGWESMSTMTETLYKKTDTLFHQWVPNVTIFRTKSQAVAKYLEECGLVGSDSSDDTTEKHKTPAVPHAAGSVELEDPNHSAEEESDVCEESDDDEEEDNQEVEVDVPVKKVPVKQAPVQRNLRKKSAPKPIKAAPKTQQAKAVVKAPVKPVRIVQKEKKPSKSIAPFEMSFGKFERELKNRGWYWKGGGLQWLYYQPHCKTKDPKSLEPNKDFFRGREELEAYAYNCGLYDHVHTKLKENHYKKYASDSEKDAESDDEFQKNNTRSAQTLVRAQIADPKPQPQMAPARRGRGRTRSVSQVQRGRSKSTARTMTTQKALLEVKFGEIWRVLSDDGWHYYPGKMEYDYFKPHCATAKDGKAGVDFFQSKDMLVEYLQTSGLWDRTADRIRAEAALSSSDEDIINSDNDAATPLQKRKHDEITPAFRQESKKHKDALLFRTPTDSKRFTAVDLIDDDEERGETISPNAAGVKSKGGQNHESGRQPLRSLANSFTPSPIIARKETRSVITSNTVEVESTKNAGPHDMILRAIQKLTSAYIPTNFCHREKEFNEIRAFFSDCFKEKINTSMYISGAPGCGKTALLKSTQSDIDQLYRECCHEHANKPIRCHVNAMALADSSALFCKLAKALTRKSFSSGNEAFEAIERATARRLKTSKTMILILDEIDTLLKNNGTENDLCRLFELAHRASHSFILIGIANQVDFTERHLPILQQRLPGCSPRVVIFEPYKHQTIEQILIDRLGGQTAASKMVSSHGISFLARKIASTTGDIRLAVDTCRRVLQHKLDQAEKENSEDSADDKELGRPLPLTDVLRIIKHALESKSASAIRSLPRNLQMILFASTRLLIVTANRAAADGCEATPLFSVNELYSCYCEVSKDAGVFKPLSQRDFRTALDTLGKEGLIAESELRKHLIKLLFSTSELLQSFRKDPFFSRLV